MTATVIDLTSRLRPEPQSCRCGRHMFEALIARATARLDAAGDALLVDRGDLEAVIDDVRDTLAATLAPGEQVRP